MLGLGPLGGFGLGEYTVLADGTVVLNPAVIVLTAALFGSAGARVEVQNLIALYHSPALGEVALGESMPTTSQASGVITLAAALDVATRTKRPTFQIIES